MRGTSSIPAGNAYAPEFRAGFNARFAVVPRETVDAHRPLLPQDHLHSPALASGASVRAVQVS